ncbi:MAG: glycoside hydrolase family 38 [Chloroflexi bacterium]|nr:glycoside hydrolase family 38 [Chloroflexota bacterium]
MSRRRVHYVLSTHWDREWHQPFQVFRYRLVQLLDRVIDGLLSRRLAGPFTCDGQAIILEDYLEVRPEQRETVTHLARQGQLVIGPWYVLPDEFLVSGESLVRNIRRGRALARDLGAPPSDAAFVCDLFGHNSQMPQIFTGFGLRGAFIWRGVNHVTTRHLRWRGADGTEIPCYKFGPIGYSTYAARVRHAFDRDHLFDPDKARQELDVHLQAEAAATEIDPILLFDGADHQEWDQPYYAILHACMHDPAYPFEIVHSTLDTYLDEMLPQSERIATLVEGELREPGRDPATIDQQWLIPGVLSSRVWIRQANAECQALLCHWAEPFSAFALAALGDDFANPQHRSALVDAQGFLNVAWGWLLKNHPHDSICGCSVDQVHEDMKFRFSQSRQIGDQLTRDALTKIAANIEGELGEDELRVVVFNSLPRPLEETAELILHIPTSWNTFNEFFGFEPQPAFRIYGADGQELPYQRLGQAMNRVKVRLYDTKFPESYRTHDVTVSLPLRLPPMGYTTLTVREGEKGLPTRHPSCPGLATGERSMANDILSVTIETNGTLTLLDKRTGQTYTRLLTFEDTADIGDGWYHGQAVNDQAVVSTACSAQVALLQDGPMVSTFRVRTRMPVPAEFHFATMTRSEAQSELLLDSLITLRPASDRVEVQTTVHNTAADHRLRVLLPTGARAETYWADSPFDVVERPIALRRDNHLYRELEVETKPQQSWTAVYDGERGLAIVARGLHESAVRDLPERPIALTLLRSTRRTVMTDDEPAGLLQGIWTFRYDIVPLAAPPDRTALTEHGQRLNAGPRDAQLLAKDLRLQRGAARLPLQASFLSLSGPAVLSSVRAVGTGLEIRFFNPTEAEIEGELCLGELAGAARRYTLATPVNLESVPLGEALPFGDGRLAYTLGAKKIATWRLT